MTQPPHPVRSTPTREARIELRVVAHQGAPFPGHSPAGDDVTEVSISKTQFKQIATKKRSIGTVLAGYADTFAKARRTGRVATITFRVSPEGEAESIEAAPHPDQLDVALAAARALGIHLIVVKRPAIDYPAAVGSIDEALGQLAAWNAVNALESEAAPLQ